MNKMRAFPFSGKSVFTMVTEKLVTIMGKISCPFIHLLNYCPTMSFLLLGLGTQFDLSS